MASRTPISDRARRPHRRSRLLSEDRILRWIEPLRQSRPEPEEALARKGFPVEATRSGCDGQPGYIDPQILIALLTQVSRLPFFVGILLCASVLNAQVHPAAFVQPAQVILPLGRSQPFQILNADGTQLASSAWSISNPDIAELQIEQGRAIVTARAAGYLVLYAAGATYHAQITIPEVGSKLQVPDARWRLRPIDGNFGKALWAAWTWGGSKREEDSSDDTAAAYFYEDRGTSSAHLRAITKQGLQVWQWPNSPSPELPRLICGTFQNGTLLSVGEGQSRYLVNLDADGRELWRVRAPGFHSISFTFTYTTFFFVEQDQEGREARIVAVDATTGTLQLSFELPRSRAVLRNFFIRDDKLVCSPGAESSKPLPIHYSHIMGDPRFAVHLMISEFSLIADAGDCAAEKFVDAKLVRLSSSQRLVAIDVTPDLVASSHTVEENTAYGPAGDASIISAIPAGDIIPGDDGTGEFVAIRRITQRWPGNGPEKVEEFQYRITADHVVKYRFPVPLGPANAPTSMLLGGGNTIGVTARGKTLVAFDTRTARELWRYESTSQNLLACIAAADGSFVVREGDHYTIIKEGKPLQRLPESFMLFVQRVTYPDREP